MERAEFENMAARLRTVLVGSLHRYVDDVNDADDIAQDTLLRLWQMRHRLEDYRSVESLARVMARNLAIDLLRHRKHVVNVDAEASDPMLSLPDSGPTPDSGLIAQDEDREKDRILSHLIPSQRAVVRMKHVEGLEIAEIAVILGTTENNVRVLLCRARANIKNLFNRE
ncbi:MAG: RNA polymerase sigma factor [Muribaculaceae bacterium]|nr:RNA polymerase sigma factor [Muribaculaceae bacterium]